MISESSSGQGGGVDEQRFDRSLLKSNYNDPDDRNTGNGEPNELKIKNH